MPTQTGGLSPEVLRAALEGLQGQLHTIEEQIQQVQSLLGGGRRGRPNKAANAAASVDESGRPRRGRRRKRTLSPEARARISAAQKKRWAAAKRRK